MPVKPFLLSAAITCALPCLPVLAQANDSPINVVNISSQIHQQPPRLLGRFYAKHFARYVTLTAPNGQPFYIVAQSHISDAQLQRCVNIVQHYLTNYPGSTYGADKSAIANQMADNGAILALLNGSDNGENPIAEDIEAQPLYAEEIQVEGGKWYMQQNYKHRDAAYEEILHWVHDFGIGVDSPNGQPAEHGAAPDFQKMIRRAQQDALQQRLWGVGESEWIDELTQENSLSQEYLAAVIDAYYGLWGAWQGSNTHSMWGIYAAKNRHILARKDPQGNSLMTAFFHPYLTYNAKLSPTLSGHFSLSFDEKKPYTHHARYLKDITLQGNHSISVTVNQYDNHITGNDAKNTVIFSGTQSQYRIEKGQGRTVVTDTVKNRDGSNTLRNIEVLQFRDKTVHLR